MIKKGDVFVLKHGDFSLGQFRATRDFEMKEFMDGYTDYHKHSLTGRLWLDQWAKKQGYVEDVVDADLPCIAWLGD